MRANGPAHRLGTRQLTQGVPTESPLPLWKRDRVRGLAPAGADESGAGQRTRSLIRTRSLRAAARVPSPCPSPARGEGTLLDGPASTRKAHANDTRSRSTRPGMRLSFGKFTLLW